MDDLNGFFFKPPLEANFIPNILGEVYRDRVYDQFMPKDKNKTLCLEVGGNLGLVSYYFARHFEKVIVLEPSAKHFPVLLQNLEYNKLTNVMPLKLALTNKNGTAEFYHHPNQTMFSLRPEVNGLPDEKEEVQTMDFETLFKTYDIEKVDFLKLDTEGEEGNIFMSEAFEKVAPKIDKIVYEWHVWSNVNHNLINGMLKDFGFTVTQIPSDATIFSAVR